MRLPPLLIGAALVIAALVYSRRSQAGVLPYGPALPPPGGGGSGFAPPAPWASDDTGTGVEPWASDDTGTGEWTTIEPDFPPVSDDGGESFSGGFMPINFPGGPTQRLIDGLLYAIRTAEVGRVPDDERYFYGYGYKRFSDTSEHPVRTRRFPTGSGELQAVPLPDRMCIAAGLSPGCVSTAAGAYQFTRPTWEEFRAAGRWGPRLPDFSPESQDEAARRLLSRIGSVAALERGDTQSAILIAGSRWASFPGSTAKQGGISMTRALELVAQGSGSGTAGTITV